MNRGRTVLVGLEALEPPTQSLGNSCSIHLSYSPVRSPAVPNFVPTGKPYQLRRSGMQSALRLEAIAGYRK